MMNTKTTATAIKAAYIKPGSQGRYCWSASKRARVLLKQDAVMVSVIRIARQFLIQPYTPI